jgi:hypothetical protein
MEKGTWVKNLAGRVVLVEAKVADKMIASGQAVAAEAPTTTRPPKEGK